MSNRIPLSARVSARVRLPAVVTWNRLEGSPRSESFDRSLRAEIRDPLWMIARQWQVGEYAATDGGTPVLARVATEVEPLAAFSDGHGAITETDLEIPLEVRVEREPVPRDVRFSVQLGEHWLRLLEDHFGDDRYRALFHGAYPLVAPTSPEHTSNVRAMQWYVGAGRRSIDGARLHADLASGLAAASTTSGTLAVSTTDQPVVEIARAEFLAWYRRSVSEPESERTWVGERLEYQFGVTTRAAGGSTTRLVADEYHGGHLDWHSFDVASQTPTRGAPATTERSYVPTPVTFVGMPSARWWEVEDQRLDFGAIDTQTTDLTKLLFIEFGLIYSNDWSLIPLPVRVGSLCRITSLVVTDVFGQATTIPPAHSDGSPWSMFTLTGTPRADSILFVPPTMPTLAESAPIECVDLLRDEMANLVWAVETTIPDQLGGGVSGREAAHELARTQDLPPDAASEVLRYRLLGTVPESWIPFVPTRVEGSSRQIKLQRGAMMGIGGTNIVRPRGALLLPDGPQTPYFIHEEEVGRSGVQVTRNWQRARWFDGRTYVWLGRGRTVGRGEGSSGLRFDEVK